MSLGLCVAWVAALLVTQGEAAPPVLPQAVPLPEAPPETAQPDEHPGPRVHDHDHDGMRPQSRRSRPPRRSDRTVRDLFDACGDGDDRACGELRGEREDAWMALRPAVMQRRSPGAAMTLGFLVGFGTGHYYAGAPRQAVVYTIVDGALVLGLLASTVALNELVIQHDFESGRSLASGDREFGRRERNLYAASSAFGALLVASHLWQGFSGLRTARGTNRILERFAVVPLAEGGVVGTLDLGL